jgi:nucleoside-diphosphate-sugar epimerase
MSGRILVLGAAGRLGFVAAGAFRDAGWTVTGLVRPRRADAAPQGIKVVEAMTREEAVEAARGCDVVLNAFNPALTEWQAARATADVLGDRRRRGKRRHAHVSGQHLELWPRNAARDRRNHADAADHA